MTAVYRALLFGVVLIATGLGAMRAGAATYYVSTESNASDSNAGTQASPWRTIKHSVSQVQAGDTVMIKGGDYGNEYITMDNIDGTSGNRITFEGYDGWPVLGVLPSPRTIDNAPPSDVAYWGFRIYRSNHITLRHLKFTYYYNCVYVELSDYVNVEDIYVDKCGTTGPSGTGIFWKYSNHGQILDCTVLDAGGNNVMIKDSNYVLVDNLTSLGTLQDEDPFCTDYYCVISTSHDVTVQNSYAEDTLRCDKGNHGFIIKDNQDTPYSYNCLIQDCTAKGFEECFSVAHYAYNNTFLRCYGDTVGKDNGFTNVLNCRNGAHDNTFKDCWGIGDRNLIGLADYAENSYGNKFNNKFINCRLTGTGGSENIAVNFRRASNNVFQNCVFDNVKYLGRYITATGEEISGNAFINCIITGANSTYDTRVLSYYPLGNGLTPYDGTGSQVFSFTDFWNNGFSTLGGSGNMAADPKFADRANRDYHLKSTAGRWNGSAWVNDAESSPCIDKGDPSSVCTLEPAPNGGRINIGAYGNTAEASKSPEGGVVASPYDNRLAERYPTIVYPSSTFLDVGHLASVDKKYRGLVWFDLSPYCGDAATSIASATLKLYWYYPSTTRTNDTIVDIYRPAAGWDPNYACWTNKASGVAWTNPGGDWFDRNGAAQGSAPYATLTFAGSQPPTDQYYSFDVTSLAREYAAAGQSSGFFIKARAESDNYIAFYALNATDPAVRPKLEVVLAVDMWVNFSWAGAESGTQANPYNTLAEGIAALTPGRTLHIQTGQTAETARIAKQMRIVAEGGSVRLGAASGSPSPPQGSPSDRNAAADWILYQ